MLSILSTPPFNILPHKFYTTVWYNEVREFFKGKKSLAVTENVINNDRDCVCPVLRSDIYIAQCPSRGHVSWLNLQQKSIAALYTEVNMKRVTNK